MLTRSKRFRVALLSFIFVNTFLYFFILLFGPIVPFDKYNYLYNSHHFFKDSRVDDPSGFSFLRALGQYDAQWYLKIAQEGYPRNPAIVSMDDKKAMDGLSYAYFPLYPVTIAVFNYFFKNVEVAGFFLANVLLAANFFSLWFVISRLYSENLAYKSVFLLFLFPFSIFYRSYFAEGLELFLVIWFSYFLVLRRFFAAAVFLGFLNVARGNVYLLSILFFVYFVKSVGGWNRLFRVKPAVVLAVCVLPFLLWLYYNFLQTGAPLYFLKVRIISVVFPIPLFWNFANVILYPILPLHSFHSSMVDVLTTVGVLLLLVHSRKFLRRELWLVSLCLWFLPILVMDSISFTRYQTVSFPLFVYLAHVLRGYRYFAVLVLFALGLGAFSLLFVNWYWIG